MLETKVVHALGVYHVLWKGKPHGQFRNKRDAHAHLREIRRYARRHRGLHQIDRMN
jgi:hypothetical protein